jgi:hypothetical protein
VWRDLQRSILVRLGICARVDWDVVQAKIGNRAPIKPKDPGIHVLIARMSALDLSWQFGLISDFDECSSSHRTTDSVSQQRRRGGTEELQEMGECCAGEI